ncbi:phage tail length tape measure family protein [Xanthomonas sp. XNM01]|uniref:phage tail length tape measure family protein n=1 Tax=Xanthomonas sp. XNM01 TaxID=2769289 RepID=UPI001782E373|nr:phage tail length tape measure family protein [Xanthomonas sp. XNM01]MBD9368860.1 phage tail length tape measure family protein [Xanthomonas sp. XNM01]
MNNPANLRVRISADLADIKQGLGLLRGDLHKLKQDAARELTGVTDGLESGLQRVKALVGGLFAGLSAGALVRGIVAETGQAQAELAQLQAALKSTQEAAGLTEADLVGMSERFAKATSFSAGEIVDAQTRLLSYSGIAANEFPRALQLAIDQSVRLGQDLTSSAEAVGKALEYPAEGVASLTKQGFRFTEEQKKLLKELERTGKLAEAQAIVMGVMEESYAGAAAAARNTLPGALKAVQNAMVELLDGNGGSGASALVSALNSLAIALQQPAVREGFGNLANQVLQLTTAFARWMAQDGVGYLTRLGEAVAFVVRHLDVLIVFLGTRLLAAGAASIPALIAQFAALRAQLLASVAAAGSLRAALALLGGPIGIAIAALTAAIYALYQRSTQAARAAEEHTRAMRDNKDMAKQSREAALADARAKREQALATLAAARSVLEERRARLAEAQSRQSSASGRRASQLAGVTAAEGTGVLDAQNQVDQAAQHLADWTKQLQGLMVEAAMEVSLQTLEGATEETKSLGEAVKGVAQASDLAEDALRRQLAALEILLADGKVSLREYYAEKERLELASIDNAITAAKEEARVAKSSDQQSKALTEIVKLQRDRAEIGPRTAREQAQAEAQLNRQLDQLRARLLEAQGDTVGARTIELKGEFEQLLQSLPAGAREAGQALVNQLVPIELAKARLDQLQADFSQATAGLQAAEQGMSAQVTAGLLGAAEGERQLQTVRGDTLTQLLALRQQSLDFLATLSPDSPEAAGVAQFISQLTAKIYEVASSMDVLRNQTADAGINALTTFFTDIANGSKSAGEALKDFVRGFAQSMAQIAARALATIAVLKLLDALYPGAGRMVAATMGVGQNHSGGVAGAVGGIRRNISPLLLGAAPRYHGGGIAGMEPLKHNEVVSVLERGETIRTEEQEAALRAQLNASTGKVEYRQPIIAFGEDQLANAMAGAAGEGMVVTHVRNNWESLTR